MPGALPDLEEVSDLSSYIPTSLGQRDFNAKIAVDEWDGDIVVYDDDRTLADDSPTWEVLDRLLPLVKGQVWYLEGGMSAASVLPRFELVVVTAAQRTSPVTREIPRETKDAKPSLLKPNAPSKGRKRSAPNLRRLDTSSAGQLSKPSLPIPSPDPTPQLRNVASVSALSIRPSKSIPHLDTPPSGSDYGNARTPRAGSPLRTPRTALQEDEFVVSSILPNFLYLGPEIAHPKHVSELKALGVKRVLNVAIECDDNLGLDLRENFKQYYRIPLKDHIEEENVSEFLQKSGDFLGTLSLSLLFALRLNS